MSKISFFTPAILHGEHGGVSGSSEEAKTFISMQLLICLYNEFPHSTPQKQISTKPYVPGTVLGDQDPRSLFELRIWQGVNHNLK